MKTDKIRLTLGKADNIYADIYREALEELAALEAENATLADENCQLRTQEISYQTQIASLEADNAAMREALDPFCGRRNSEGYDPDDPACSVRCISAWRCKALALTPDSGKVLVNVPTLMLLRDTIQELLDVQNGCPLPKYQEMFDAANEQADEMLGWLAALLKDRP